MKNYIKKCSECDKIISKSEYADKNKKVIFDVCDECLKKLTEFKKSNITGWDDELLTPARSIKG